MRGSRGTQEVDADTTPMTVTRACPHGDKTQIYILKNGFWGRGVKHLQEVTTRVKILQ